MTISTVPSSSMVDDDLRKRRSYVFSSSVVYIYLNTKLWRWKTKALSSKQAATVIKIESLHSIKLYYYEEEKLIISERG